MQRIVIVTCITHR